MLSVQAGNLLAHGHHNNAATHEPDTLFEGNAATASQRNCKLMQPKWGHSYMLLGCKN